MRSVKNVRVYTLEEVEQLGELGRLARLGDNYYRLLFLDKEGRVAKELVRYEDLIVYIEFSDTEPVSVAPIFLSAKELEKYLHKFDVYP